MIFVDTWAWIALASRRDQYHQVAKLTHRGLVRDRRTYVISDFVVSELITQLDRILNTGEAATFVQKIFDAVDAGTYRLEHVSPDLFRRSWSLKRKLADKPDISFVDVTTMVIMQELGVTDIFTGDAHFQHVGLGFRLFPAPG